MGGRIESEAKKAAFIKACEDIDPLKLIPDKLLQSEELIENLRRDELDISMLYKCGCPCDWIPDAYRECNSLNPKPRHSNECSNCWLYNLTDEIDLTDQREYNYKEVLKKYKQYESLGLSPDELFEILECLGWTPECDFQVFIDTLQDMMDFYKRK